MQTTTPNSVVQWIKPRLSGIHHKCLYPLRPLETHNSFFLKICHRSQDVTAYISSRALAAHWGWEGGGLESPSQGSGAWLPQLYFIARLIGLLVSFTIRVIVTCFNDPDTDPCCEAISLPSELFILHNFLHFFAHSL